MSENGLLRTVREWRARRRMMAFLHAHPRARTIVEFRGCRFFAGTDNKVEASLLRGERGYDHANFTALAHFIRPGQVCCDVGANVGVYSVVMARLAESPGLVHAFEPVEHVRARLLANARLNGFHSLRVNAFALGADEGSRAMYQVKDGTFRAGTSTFVRTENLASIGEGEFETRPVEVRTLDGYAAEAGVARVDFLKIDVEGFELQVLQGASRTLDRFQPVVLLEYDQERHGALGHRGQLQSLLAAHGYRAHEFTAFGDRLVLRPFEFSGQPRNRNLLCLRIAASS